jgi:class 3 adenylate cyclase
LSRSVRRKAHPSRRGPQVPGRRQPRQQRTYRLPTAEPERRHLTVASCELIPAPDAGVDVEDRHEITGAYRRCVEDTLGRQGAVGAHIGNAVIVYFGYPAAHEYDAEQAVRAGLDLCAAVEALSAQRGLALRCRAGIATGPAIAGNPARLGAATAGAIVETGQRQPAYALLAPIHAAFTEGTTAPDVVAARDLLDSLR